MVPTWSRLRKCIEPDCQQEAERERFAIQRCISHNTQRRRVRLVPAVGTYSGFSRLFRAASTARPACKAQPRHTERLRASSRAKSQERAQAAPSRRHQERASVPSWLTRARGLQTTGRDRQERTSASSMKCPTRTSFRLVPCPTWNRPSQRRDRRSPAATETTATGSVSSNAATQQESEEEG